MKVIKDHINTDVINISNVTEDHTIIALNRSYPSQVGILTAIEYKNKVYQMMCLNSHFTRNNKIGKSSTLEEWLNNDTYNWYAFDTMKEALEFAITRL